MSVVIKIKKSTFTVTVATPAVFSATAHGLVLNDIVYLSTTGALPTGLDAVTPYYVISAGLTADAFRVSTSLGGSAVNTTGTQSGVHTFWRDRTLKVENTSLNINRQLTSQVDTCRFSVLRKGGAVSGGYKPTLLDDVLIGGSNDNRTDGILLEVAGFLFTESGDNILSQDYKKFVMEESIGAFPFSNLDLMLKEDGGQLLLDGTFTDAQTLFAGQIVQMDSTVIDGSDIERFDCVAKDYSYDMNRHLVTGTYENMAIETVIELIRDEFLGTAYSTEGVSCPLIVTSISFNYESPTACLKQLADLVNYDWYVDGAKRIFFFQKGAVLSPFNLDDTGEKYYFNTLVLKDNINNIRNSITVRGGEYIGATRTETVVSDGQATVYKQGYRYTNISVTVNGVAQTVGIDNLHDPASYDCLYNYQEKLLRWRSANKPAISVNVAVTGSPRIPVLIRLVDAASVLQYGEFEFKILDKSITTRDEARDRAMAELAGYAATLNEGSFETKSGGLEVGQQITVASTIRGVSTDFVISNIVTTMTNGQEFTHRVTLVTTRAYGMIEFLMSLLTAQDKDIVITPNEIFGAIRSLADTGTFTDSIPAPTTTSAPYLWDTALWGTGTWG